MDRKVLRLIDDLIENRLSATDAAALERVLREEPEVRAAYLELMGVHRDLVSLESPVRPFSREELRTIKAVEDCVGEFDNAHPQNPTATVRPPSARGGLRLDRFKYGTLGLLLGTAASALVALTLATPDADGPVAPVAQAAPAANVVAKVIRKIDCDWETERWSAAPSSQIEAGQQINLAAGLLVLEYNSGVELTLNGPATFVATSDKSAQLLSGQLSARVPVKGRGFTVETHAGDFVDLGTEFGMIVTEEGSVETHVFKGEVVAKPTSVGSEAAKSVLLQTGVAWARGSSSDQGGKVGARPELFVRSLATDRTFAGEKPAVSDRLVLWLDAANRLQLDQNRSVSAWGDQLCDADASPNDAWQVVAEKRPVWIKKGPNGRPALRFDGHKGLVTEPLRLGSNHTSAVVFRVNRKLATKLIAERDEYQYLGVQLLNLNGPPHTVLQVNDDARVEARIHRGWLREFSDPVDSGYTISHAPLSDGTHVVLYVYDSANSLSQLYIDGELAAESYDAPELSATETPRYIGSHFEREGFGFAGDISEVMVYDAALSPDEAIAMSHWLAAKHQAPLNVSVQAAN